MSNDNQKTTEHPNEGVNPLKHNGAYRDRTCDLLYRAEASSYSSETDAQGRTRQNLPSLPRTSGEIPAPKDNVTTICVPHAIDRISFRLQLLVPGLL